MINDLKNYQPENTILQNRIIAITGAGSGIGRELAKGLASYGATIILIGRNVEKLETIYDEIESNNNPQAAIVPLDLETASDADYKNLAEMIKTEFGRLDGLINNAAQLGDRTSINNYPLKVWEKLMKVNVNAPFAITKYLLPLLEKSDHGSVVFTSSTVGIKGRAYWGAYAASKAAIENLMQTLADELEETSHIRVNSINPGATRTDMRALAYPAEDPATVKEAKELTPLFLYFMAKDSIGVTGQQVSF